MASVLTSTNYSGIASGSELNESGH